MSDTGQDAWKAPGSGTPLTPGDVASIPSASDIANQVVSKLAVPKGPLRTVSFLLGSALSPGALNSKIQVPILGAPGLISTIEIVAQLVTTGAAAGFLQLFDMDSNSPLLRTYPINVGAAGSYQLSFSSGPGLPFLGGISALWTPLIAAFGACIVVLNIDYNSIPIGQK